METSSRQNDSYGRARHLARADEEPLVLVEQFAQLRRVRCEPDEIAVRIRRDAAMDLGLEIPYPGPDVELPATGRLQKCESRSSATMIVPVAGSCAPAAAGSADVVERPSERRCHDARRPRS